MLSYTLLLYIKCTATVTFYICIRNAFHFIYNLTKFTPFQPRQRMLARRWLVRCYEISM